MARGSRVVALAMLLVACAVASQAPGPYYRACSKVDCGSACIATVDGPGACAPVSSGVSSTSGYVKTACTTTGQTVIYKYSTANCTGPPDAGPTVEPGPDHMKYGECQALQGGTSILNTCVNPIPAVEAGSSSDDDNHDDKLAVGFGVGLICCMCTVLFCGMKLLQREQAKELEQASSVPRSAVVEVQTNSTSGLDQQAEVDKDFGVPGMEEHV